MSAVADIPERGSLSDHPLPHLLLALHPKRFTGSLELSRARTKKSFRFQDGAPVGSESNLPAESLGALLEDAGRIDRAARRAVEDHLAKNRCREGVAFLALQLLEPRELFEALQDQTRRRLVECFGWTAGDYTLEASDERRDDLQPFRTEPYPIVQEGLQKHWSAERMLEDLGPGLTRYASSGPRLGRIVKRLHLDATVERMIAGLSGRQVLGSVISGAVSSPAALAAFWVLHVAGGIEYADAPKASEQAEGETEIEIHVTRAGGGSAAARKDAAGPAKPGAASRLRNSPEAEKMRAEVLERRERLEELSYYDLLGVETNAAHAAIRKAYFLAAKRYHPDAIARLGLQDIRTEAGEVFSKIAEANEVLADKDRRAAYDQSLESGGEIDIAVLAQAETFYRKGEILIKMGDFRGALEFMRNAVELYPGEAAYQSALGWCYYKKSPPERDLALEHLGRALEIDPADHDAQFKLGVIERDAA